MNKTTTPVVPAIVLRRTYKASRQRVFDAWTNPEIAAKFLGPGEGKAEIVEMNARAGGSYRIVMHMPDGSTLPVFGTYREVRAPEHLSMTWRWEEDNPADEYDSLVTLDFIEVNGATELTLTHEQLKTVESRDNHESGWTAIVDQLAAVL
jgi:uncharacterized protein YndB with AHSA1/START domain